MGFNALFPVSTNKGKHLIVALGSASFTGNGTNQVQASVRHGLNSSGLSGAPRLPQWVDIFPALVSPGATGWGAETGQTAPADQFSFYVFAYAGASIFGVGYTYFFNWIAIG